VFGCYNTRLPEELQHDADSGCHEVKPPQTRSEIAPGYLGEDFNQPFYHSGGRAMEDQNVKNLSLLDRVKELLPAIRARRADIEQARQLPRDLADMLRETGVFSLEFPRALGGPEVPFPDIMRAIETIATADGSTGWCVALAVPAGQIAGFMDESGAREVFADPNAPTAGIFAPGGTAVRVDGGVIVNGRWPFASGITHSGWVWAACLVMENGQPRMTATGPEIINVFVPVSDVEIHDTWHVSGLCGTGSNDISIRELFVPERRIFILGDPTRRRQEPLYRLPMVGAFVSHVAAVSLGIARGALDELVELAQTKVPTFSMVAMAEKPLAQVELARAETALAAARAFFYETVEELWRIACAGGEPTLRQIALNRTAAANATDTAAEVTRTANRLAGGSAIFTASSLQRHMRDAEAIAHHFTVAPYVWEDAGRVFMGREPAAPIF
jgi:alkylation response protein AidB-like acyl-CoA dehydrogenase